MVIQSVNAPADVTDPGIGQTLVLVDTLAGSWIDASILTLPASPQSGGRVYVKDEAGNAGTKSIVVSGNGNTIDGSGTRSLNSNFEALTIAFDGTSWSVI